MNQNISHLTAAEHFSQFWNSHDNWFLERDQIKAHLFNGSLRLTDIADAMKPGKVCEEFCFNWNWHNARPPSFYRLLERHEYNLRSLFNELRSLSWQHRKHWKTGEPQADWQSLTLANLAVQMPKDFGQLSGDPGDNVELYRSELRSVRVWSPFAKVSPLTEKPNKWTIPHVIRALLTGQFTRLKCDGVYTDDYAYDAAVDFQRGEISGRDAVTAFARRILENPSGWWAYERDGEVSVCCHHFDSNSFTFDLMKRFNPAASAAPNTKGDAVTIERPVETDTPEASRQGAKARREPVSNISITINDARQLVELRFPDKPDEDVRAEMKAARFRWFGPAGCWYHKHTPENLAWAQAFASRQAGSAPSPAPVVNVTPQVAPLRGMTPLGASSWRQRFHR